MNTINKANLDHLLIKVAFNNQTIVKIYLINGIKLQGYIKAYDDCAIILGSSLVDPKISQIIYKHSIATILLS